MRLAGSGYASPRNSDSVCYICIYIQCEGQRMNWKHSGLIAQTHFLTRALHRLMESIFFFTALVSQNAFPCLWGHLCRPTVPTTPSATFSGTLFRLWAPLVLLCHFMTQLRARKGVNPGTPAAERAQELGESRAPSHAQHW